MIDFIGDIHGHADELEALLAKLGYTESNGSYSHPGRKVVFVGDYIDRGPKIVRTLEIVKAMVDSGNAVALMGNHEYNAICFHFPEKEGGHLRKHLIKNVLQHFETMKQFQNRQQDYEFYIDWFKTLPLYYETEEFRAVHASWDHKHIAYLRSVLHNHRLNDELIYESVKKGSPLYLAIDDTLKGKEIRMPEGLYFNDKDGTLRNKIRVKWWDNPADSTYHSISVEKLDVLPHTPIEVANEFYGENEKPVFFGHYWLKGNPTLYRNNICCLDYSVAKQGKLVAYRFDGEKELQDSKLVYV